MAADGIPVSAATGNDARSSSNMSALVADRIARVKAATKEHQRICRRHGRAYAAFKQAIDAAKELGEINPVQYRELLLVNWYANKAKHVLDDALFNQYNEDPDPEAMRPKKGCKVTVYSTFTTEGPVQSQLWKGQDGVVTGVDNETGGLLVHFSDVGRDAQDDTAGVTVRVLPTDFDKVFLCFSGRVDPGRELSRERASALSLSREFSTCSASTAYRD